MQYRKSTLVYVPVNKLTDFQEIWYDSSASETRFNNLLFNFLHSVIKTWPVGELIRR
jgi:hypothetical protein